MERKIPLLDAGKGQKGCSGSRGAEQPQAPSPCCSPLLSQGAGAEEQQQRHPGRSQAEGRSYRTSGPSPCCQPAQDTEVLCSRKEAGRGPCPELALLRSAFTQKGKLAVLQDARSH